MGTFKDLIVYKKAFALALEVREVTRKFPKEELYTLTDQVQRSSRSVCANLAESYRKRRYVAHFISKLTDSDAECSETIVHLDFALAFGYIIAEQHGPMVDEYEQVGKLLNDMMSEPYKYGVRRS
jgi:four helix bundle protein